MINIKRRDAKFEKTSRCTSRAGKTIKKKQKKTAREISYSRGIAEKSLITKHDAARLNHADLPRLIATRCCTKATVFFSVSFSCSFLLLLSFFSPRKVLAILDTLSFSKQRPL